MYGTHSLSQLDERDLFVNMLEDGRERKDVRVFAHAAAESQLAIRESMSRNSMHRPHNHQEAVLISNCQESGFLEVFPRVASRPPKLLQELESILMDRLRSNDKAASARSLPGKDRDNRLAANLTLDAHRQVLGAFNAGFGGYSGLLGRLQTEFDTAVDHGVACARENVGLRVGISVCQQQLEAACCSARGEVMSLELPFKTATFKSLQHLKERSTKAAKRLVGAERELAAAKLEEQRMHRNVARLTEQKLAAEEVIASEARWTIQPTSVVVTELPVGPMTVEDEAFLEAEFGASMPEVLTAQSTETASVDDDEMSGMDNTGFSNNNSYSYKRESTS